MTYQTLVDLLVIAAAIPETLFVIGYPILSPDWWRTWIGRALVTASTGLATLLDISLAAKWFGWQLPEWVTVVILVLIAAGSAQMFVALLVAKFFHKD